MRDQDIDAGEIPTLDQSFFENAELRLPQSKSTITIRLDPEVLKWFKGKGKGYQTRINAVLKMYIEAQKN